MYIIINNIHTDASPRTGKLLFTKGNKQFILLDNGLHGLFKHYSFGNTEVVIYGEIYNIENNISEKEYIQMLHKKYGVNFPKDINSDCIIIIWENNTINVFRDKMGTIPLYYYYYNEELQISSGFKKISDNIHKKKTNDNWIINAICNLYSPSNETVIEDIFRLPPANALKIENGKLSISKYWKFDLSINKDCYDEKFFIENLSMKLKSAVYYRIKGQSEIGSDLSGGLDSSSVTALATLSGTKVFAFSQIMEDDSYQKQYPYNDEREFSRAVANLYPEIIPVSITGVESGLLESIIMATYTLGYPVQHNYASFLNEIFSFAKENNLKILLSGYGGDEGVSNQCITFVKEKIIRFDFDRLNLYIEQIQKFFRYSKLRIYTAILSEILFFNLRKKIHNLAYKNPNRIYIDAVFIKTVKIKNRKIEKLVSLNSAIYYMLGRENIAQRMESMTEYSMQFGLLYRFPLLDTDLLQFFISIPSDIKANPSETRHLFRQAMKSCLPEIVVNRDDKSGTTVPHNRIRQSNDYEKINNFILFCKENLRTHYVNYEKVMELNLNLKTKNTKGPKISLPTLNKILGVLTFQLMTENYKIDDLKRFF